MQLTTGDINGTYYPIQTFSFVILHLFDSFLKMITLFRIRISDSY